MPTNRDKKPSNDPGATPIQPPSRETERHIVQWLRDLALVRAALPVGYDLAIATINANTVQTILAVANMIENNEHRKGG